MLTLKGRNEEKVKFSAEHLKKRLEQELRDVSGLVIAGPGPAPLLRAETYYRYQVMLRTQRMSFLSKQLATLLPSVGMPDDVSLTVDVDPTNLG